MLTSQEKTKINKNKLPIDKNLKILTENKLLSESKTKNIIPLTIKNHAIINTKGNFATNSFKEQSNQLKKNKYYDFYNKFKNVLNTKNFCISNSIKNNLCI